MGLDFSHGRARWGYGSFMKFRNRLTKACGLEGDLRENYGNGNYKKLKHHKLYPFINHSDCDGHLTVSEMEQIKPELEKIIKEWDDDDFHKIQTLDLIEGMEEAIANDEKLEFC